MNRETMMYCALMEGSKGEYLFHFYPHLLGVRMSLDSRRPRPIKHVKVTEGTDQPGSYWAWWDNERKSWSMVFPSKLQVEICFPYGTKIEEKHGKGFLLPVNIEILGDVNEQQVPS